MSEGILERSDITKLLQDARNAGYNSGYTAGQNSSPLASKLKDFGLQIASNTASIAVRDGSSGWTETGASGFPAPSGFEYSYPYLVYVSYGYLQWQSGTGVFSSQFDGEYYWAYRDTDRTKSPYGRSTFSGTYISLPQVLLAPTSYCPSIGLRIYSRGYRVGQCSFSVYLNYKYYTTKLD